MKKKLQKVKLSTTNVPSKKLNFSPSLKTKKLNVHTTTVSKPLPSASKNVMQRQVSIPSFGSKIMNRVRAN
jgi:hypothetical protein